MPTDNHGLEQPSEGSTDWHIPLNSNFGDIEVDIEVRDTAANRSSYTPHNGAKYLETDTFKVYIGDGSSWNLSHVVVDPSNFNSNELAQWNGNEFTGTGLPSGTAVAELLSQGNIVVTGGGYFNSFLPSSVTGTDPLTEAVNQVRNNATNGFGKILLPFYGSIDASNGPYSDWDNIGLFSAYNAPCTLRFTDTTADGIVLDGDDGRFRIGGRLSLDGTDSNRTTGVAIRCTGYQPFVQIDDLHVTQWNGNVDDNGDGFPDGVVCFDDDDASSIGHTFESQWRRLYGGNYEGVLLGIFDAGEPCEFQQVVVGPESLEDGVLTRSAGGSIQIGMLVARANKFTESILTAVASANTSILIRNAQYETSYTGAVEEVMRLNGLGDITVNNLRVTAVDGSVDYIYRSTYRPSNYQLADPNVTNSVVINNSKFGLDEDPREIVNYGGKRSHITNNTGIAEEDLSFAIDCRDGYFGPNPNIITTQTVSLTNGAVTGVDLGVSVANEPSVVPIPKPLTQGPTVGVAMGENASGNWQIDVEENDGSGSFDVEVRLVRV